MCFPPNPILVLDVLSSGILFKTWQLNYFSAQGLVACRSDERQRNKSAAFFTHFLPHKSTPLSTVSNVSSAAGGDGTDGRQGVKVP